MVLRFGRKMSRYLVVSALVLSCVDIFQMRPVVIAWMGE